MEYYTVYWVFDNKHIPVKDMEPGTAISVTQPDSQERLTIQEARQRFYQLADKCPNRQFIIKDSNNKLVSSVEGWGAQ